MITGICIALIAGIFIGDLWIKNRIEKIDSVSFPIKLAKDTLIKDMFIKDLLILKKYHNIGAMLNLGAARRKVMTAISVVFTILLSFAFLLSLGQRGNNVLRIGLSFLLGGSFSNTYDRLKRKYVVDYLSFNVKWKWFREIVFNVSDFCIIIGSLLTALGASAHSEKHSA